MDVIHFLVDSLNFELDLLLKPLFIYCVIFFISK